LTYPSRQIDLPRALRGERAGERLVACDQRARRLRRSGLSRKTVFDRRLLSIPIGATSADRAGKVQCQVRWPSPVLDSHRPDRGHLPQLVEETVAIGLVHGIQFEKQSAAAVFLLAEDECSRADAQC